MYNLFQATNSHIVSQGSAFHESLLGSCGSPFKLILYHLEDITVSSSNGQDSLLLLLENQLYILNQLDRKIAYERSYYFLVKFTFICEIMSKFISAKQYLNTKKSIYTPPLLFMCPCVKLRTVCSDGCNGQGVLEYIVGGLVCTLLSVLCQYSVLMCEEQDHRCTRGNTYAIVNVCIVFAVVWHVQFNYYFSVSKDDNFLWFVRCIVRAIVLKYRRKFVICCSVHNDDNFLCFVMCIVLAIVLFIRILIKNSTCILTFHTEQGETMSIMLIWSVDCSGCSNGVLFFYLVKYVALIISEPTLLTVAVVSTTVLFTSLWWDLCFLGLPPLVSSLVRRLHVKWQVLI